MRDVDQAIALDNRKMDVFYSRGTLRAGLGQYDGAIADFDRILARRTNLSWLVGRGVAKFLKGDFAAAAADFQQAALRAPADEDVQIWLTRASLQAGLPDPGVEVRAVTVK